VNRAMDAVVDALGFAPISSTAIAQASRLAGMGPCPPDLGINNSRQVVLDNYLFPDGARTGCFAAYYPYLDIDKRDGLRGKRGRRGDGRAGTGRSTSGSVAITEPNPPASGAANSQDLHRLRPCKTVRAHRAAIAAGGAMDVLTLVFLLRIAMLRSRSLLGWFQTSRRTRMGRVRPVSTP
jgi:hypothetical protein